MTQEMATFYPPSSGQVDVLSTPYMEDQKFASYSEPNVLHGNMMMYMNPSSSSGSFSEIPPGNSISTHTNNCVDMPRNEVMFIPPNGDSMCIQTINGQLNTAAPPDAIPSSVSEQQLQLTSRSQLNFVDGEQNLHGLSLSLSSNTIPAPFQHQFSNTHGFSSILNSHLPGDNSCPSLSDKVDEGPQRKDLINSGYGSYDLEGDGSNAIRFGAPNNLHCSANPKEVVSYSGVSYQQYEQAGIANAILKSTYLKAAQMLLDEVVNVKEALQQHESLKDQSNTNKVEEGSSESKEKSVPSSENNELNSTNSAPELSPTERLDMQNKLDKLLGMLEEVDRRYKQYYHQMQILVSSFDLVAGSGAAKPYTALALKTISRHFRCLRDAISTQIQATRKSLGEQDPAQGGVIPRLRFVDQQLRQQRALQQFGMMRHAWRPQRGLPENAVTVLRAWLFEHFLHPYPKDSEKIMLARQTGLTRSQVANWFINARVRLWKPMVEEMYKEEFNEADLINAKAFADHNTSRAPGEQSWASEDRREDQQESMSSMANNNNYHHSQIQELSTTRRTGPEMLIPAPLEGDEEEKQRGMMLMKLQDEHESSLDDHHHHQSHGFYQHNQNGVMVPTSAYHVPQGLTGSYGASNNQVSLALGLRQIDGDINSLSAGPATAGFRPGESSHNNEMGAGTPDYSSYLETVNQQQQQQHRFSNPHLLNDFVS